MKKIPEFSFINFGKRNIGVLYVIPLLTEIANFSMKYLILSKVYTNEGGIK